MVCSNVLQTLWPVLFPLCSCFILFGVIIVFQISVGTANNAGAILVLGRDLVVVPKLIHPLPPAISSPETSPERQIEDTWMQVHYFKYYAYIFNLRHVVESMICKEIDHLSLWNPELNANRPPTPTIGRPQVANDRGSLAWI